MCNVGNDVTMLYGHLIWQGCIVWILIADMILEPANLMSDESMPQQVCKAKQFICTNAQHEMWDQNRTLTGTGKQVERHSNAIRQ